MIILRIILGIVAIPFLLLAYILKGFFYLLTQIGAKIVTVIGGLLVFGGIVIIGAELLGSAAMGSNGMVGTAFSLIGIGVLVILSPFVAAFLSELFGGIAEWIREKVYRS